MRQNQHQTQKQNLKNNLKTEDGSGLVLSLMVLLVLSVLGSALGILTIRSHNLADITRDSSSAYYIAEAGANMAYEEVENYVLEAYEDSTIATDFFGKIEEPFGEENNKNTVVYQEDFAPQNGDQPKATVNIKENTNNEGSTSDKKQYIIESTGDIDGKTKTVEKAVDIEWLDKEEKIEIEIPSIPANAAIIAKEEIIFPNSGNYDVIGDTLVDSLTKVEGHAATNHTQMTNNEAITVGPIKWDAYNNVIKNFPKEPTHTTEILYSAENEIDILKNTKIMDANGNSKMDINNNLVINTDGKNVYLIVDDLTISNNIQIEGTGKVNFYVKNTLNFGSDITVNQGKNTNQINIIYVGKSDVKLNNKITINGTLFIKEADLKLDGSGSGDTIDVTINGSIISGASDTPKNNDGNIFLANGATLNTRIIAPHSKVFIDNHADLTGVVIADIVEMQNHSKITYSNPNDAFKDILVNESTGENTETTVVVEDLISSQPAIEP